jgi:hypothetical protein
MLPDDVNEVPIAQIPALLAQLASLQMTLAARLMVPVPPPPKAEADVMLAPDEAAALLKQSRRWLARNCQRLPFVKRVSERRFICSKNGLEKWLAARKF